LPPTISNARLTLPPDFRFTGGDVTISADVTDPSGVRWVKAIVGEPDGSKVEVTLSLPSGSTYQGLYNAPPNARNDGQAIGPYTVHVRAEDNAGNPTPEPGVAVGEFTVPAAEKPQDPPTL